MSTPPASRRRSSSRQRLPELRRNRRISDGGSRLISDSVKAQSLAYRRSSSRDDSRHGLETYITCLIQDLRYCLKELGGQVTNAQLEEWAILIHECLSTESRIFHSIHHVFEISVGCDSIQMLGACFRDSISFVTDGELSPKQSKYVESILVDGSHLLSRGEKKDEHLDLVMDIFGLSDGQDVRSYDGLNVFMSAVLATRVLSGTISSTHLAQVVTCMEATIPFRPPVDGKTALDRLFERLKQATTKHSLELQEEDIEETIQKAADLANRHIGNFATDDVASFLDHTWCLLPERSAALRRSFLYTVNDFLLATRDMERFMVGLQIDRVFQTFRGVPEGEEMESFHTHTAYNLEKGRKYLRAKLLSVCVIGAFAVLTGGDAPMSFFCGDLPSPGQLQSDRLGDSFPEATLDDDCDLDVYEIMTRGRNVEQVFDTRNDPLAAFVYAALGNRGVNDALALCSFPMTLETARKLLEFLPSNTVQLVGLEIGKIALSRADGFKAIVEELTKSSSATKGGIQS